MFFIKYNNRLINISLCLDIEPYIEKESNIPMVRLTTQSGHTTRLKFKNIQDQNRFFSLLDSYLTDMRTDFDHILKNQKRRGGSEDV